MDNSEQTVSLIAAVGKNNAIGLGNRLLWSLPEDMAYFKQTTLGRPVIMGRKTWESLPERFRPLPGRHNIVVSRDPAYAAPGATLAGSLEAAIAAAGPGELFIIGGAQLYALGIVRADRLYLTEVDDTPVADAFFPPVPESDWREVSRRPGVGSAPGYAFVVLERREKIRPLAGQ